MDNAAWFTQQLRHWRDNVAWTTERALTEISLRETELYALWTDQAARDYRARYGRLREEVQADVLESLRKIVAAMESLEAAIADVTHHAQLVDVQLSEARYASNRVSAHIDTAYRHISDYELHSSEVEIKIENARAAMQRALQLLSSSETAAQAYGAKHQESQSEIRDGCSDIGNTVHISESSDSGRVSLWHPKKMSEFVGAGGFNTMFAETRRFNTPNRNSLCALTSGRQGDAMNPGGSIGSITPSWAFRQGDDLVLGFSTTAPPGALPFLGTSPAPATSYLSLRLGSDWKWRTPLGFGSAPASYDLKIGTSSLSLGGSAFEYAPPISVASPGFGLSTGGGAGISPIQSFGGMGMEFGNSAWGGTFGNSCCLSS